MTCTTPITPTPRPSHVPRPLYQAVRPPLTRSGKPDGLYAGCVLFIFGYGIKRQHLGAGVTRTCPRCHNTTQWARIRQFKQFTFFFVPLARWNRRQLEECGICGTVAQI